MPRIHLTDEQLDTEVLFRIKRHVGRKNAIGRWELVAKIYGAVLPQDQNDSNPADRLIREAVARLRKRGVLICDMGNGQGRYLAETIEEYQQFRIKYSSRAYEILETLREMDKAAEQTWDSNPLQMRLV